MMYVQSTIKKRRACAARAVLVDGSLCSLFNLRMVSKTQIAVGTKHQDSLSTHRHHRILIARNLSEIGVHPLGLSLLGCRVSREFSLQWFH